MSREQLARILDSIASFDKGFKKVPDGGKAGDDKGVEYPLYRAEGMHINRQDQAAGDGQDESAKKTFQCFIG